MTKTTRDIPTSEGMTVADRLKTARTNAGLTHKALAEVTGIPFSSLQKFEYGIMEPTLSRLKTICEILNVSFDWVLTGDDAPNIADNEGTAENQLSESVSDNSSENVSDNSSENVSEKLSEGVPDFGHGELPNEPSEIGISTLLNMIDVLRVDNFENVYRRSMALVDQAKSKLKYLEPFELEKLAIERGLHKDDDQLPGFLESLFQDNPENAQKYCGNIEERILDTAILGIDLFMIEGIPLIKLAEQYDIEPPETWMLVPEWGEHEEFVPLMRPTFRMLALSGKAIEFTDIDNFPRQTDVNIID